jgi:hypothetical protein
MDTQSFVTSTQEYETLIKAVEAGLYAVDEKNTGLSLPFELKIDDEPVELTRKEIEKICSTSFLAEQYKKGLKKKVNEKGEIGKLNDFSILSTMNGVMTSLELAMNNAFTLTPARAFCHSQVFMNSLKTNEDIYESFVVYVNNLLTDAKEPNPA